MSSVFDFGAKGDGTTDDTGAIQHAIEAGGGDITFLHGNYLIRSTIVVDLAKTGRLSLRGLGGLAKIIMVGPGPAILVKGSHDGNAAPGNFKPQVWSRERMPTIDGIEIEGAHPEADGVRLEGVMQATLTRVLMRKLRTAVHVTKRSRNILIDACHLYHNTGVGVHLDHVNLHQCIISASHISYCRLGGIRIDGGEIRNLQITGNDIEYNNARGHGPAFADKLSEPTAEIYIDIQDGSVREGTISSNTIQATVSPNGSNIRFIGSKQKNDLVGFWTISGNLIGNQECNIHLTRAWGVVISGNQIYGATKRNLLIEDCNNIVIGPNMIGHCPDFNASNLVAGVRFENSSNCIISGLQVQDSQAAPGSAPPIFPADRQALLELIRCRQLNMTGCQLQDGTPTGLLVEECSNTAINCCQILDQREEKQMVTGIDTKGSLKGVVIAQCQILGATGQALQGGPHPGLTVMNNVSG